MSTNTVTLHRVFTATSEKLFKAFSDTSAMASWIPPYGFLCTIHKMDFRIGGSYKMTFTNFGTGSSNSFGGTYVDLKVNEFIQYTDKFDNPDLPGEMITTIWFRKVMCGTEIRIEQKGIPDIIPVEVCYLGWQKSLDKLKRLVEPVIPDQG